ncbi:hypothetical protein EZJ43_10455 [Pedobacter changchengzhani]|uniref:Uncharacterized protein n=1 Tax=Pedobacter changchengzhani TaxID=2529274 RepID=A0A4V3A037_9SPHI|nr:hypothetical protein [Pedobacter changchengzhani]TDG36093.1 hypothetical protein EZJ43_10455 [Pedobacter changchengzhani]
MASKKEDLENYLRFLQNLTEDLSDYQARSGKNKTIRDKETSKISHAVTKFDRYLQNNKGLSDLLFEYHGGNEYGYDETLSFKYIVRDVSRFMGFLKEKLAINE